MNKAQGRRNRTKKSYYENVQPRRTAQNKVRKITRALALIKPTETNEPYRKFLATRISHHRASA